MQIWRQRIAEDFDPAEYDGLRVSQIRVIHHVPVEGATVTRLAERLAMTKQGCGQFVTQLIESGHLAEQVATQDRRLRVVIRTDKGDALMRAQRAYFAERERTWAARVGPRRFATFRKVLEELALTEAGD
jgi:DNA-binding MarR family transcriptional regulator